MLRPGPQGNDVRLAPITGLRSAFIACQGSSPTEGFLRPRHVTVPSNSRRARRGVSFLLRTSFSLAGAASPRRVTPPSNSLPSVRVAKPRVRTRVHHSFGRHAGASITSSLQSHICILASFSGVKPKVVLRAIARLVSRRVHTLPEQALAGNVQPLRRPHPELDSFSSIRIQGRFTTAALPAVGVACSRVPPARPRRARSRRLISGDSRPATIPRGTRIRV